MPTHWDVFKGGPTRPSNERINVTINNKYTINFNKFAVKVLGNPRAVLLMFDKKESTIGVVPTVPSDQHAFPVKPKGGGLNYIVHAAPFCRHFGIVVDRTEKFDDAVVDEGVLRLTLARTHDVSNRRKRWAG